MRLYGFKKLRSVFAAIFLAWGQFSNAVGPDSVPPQKCFDLVSDYTLSVEVKRMLTPHELATAHLKVADVGLDVVDPNHIAQDHQFVVIVDLGITIESGATQLAFWISTVDRDVHDRGTCEIGSTYSIPIDSAHLLLNR